MLCWCCLPFSVLKLSRESSLEFTCRPHASVSLLDLAPSVHAAMLGAWVAGRLGEVLRELQKQAQTRCVVLIDCGSKSIQSLGHGVWVWLNARTKCLDLDAVLCCAVLTPVSCRDGAGQSQAAGPLGACWPKTPVPATAPCARHPQAIPPSPACPAQA